MMDSLTNLTVWLEDNLSFTAPTVFKLILAVHIAETAWELYLKYRQHKIYKNTTEMPDALIGITKRDEFEKARVYALDKSNFYFFKTILSETIDIALLSLSGMAYMWALGDSILERYGDWADNEIVQGAAFIVISNTLSAVIQLPFSIYYTFWLEEKHGFNKQTIGFFIKDSIKAYILMQVLSVIVSSIVVAIVQAGGKYFFLYLWGAAMILLLFFMTIYMDFIAPLFDKYTPLAEGELRTQIEKLAASIEFPLKKIYVVEGSKRSSHSNAYFYGFFKNKRIVLFDTLLKNEGDEKGKGCSDSEVLAVLAHELGHWHYNHVLQNLILMQVNMLLMFVVFALVFKYKPIYQAMGFNTTPVLIGLMVVLKYVMAPYSFILNWVMMQLSRSFEFSADLFAKKLGRTYSLKAALIKLNADNLGFPLYDPLYSSWHNSHPSLLERIEALEKDE